MNTLFLVSFLIEGISGIILIFAPAAFFGQMGATLNGVATTLARAYGSALIGLSMMLWFARQSRRPVFKMGMIYSMFVFYLLSTTILMIGQLTGETNVMGWGVMALSGIFLVWYGYFFVKYAFR
jgi:hypothetical protein